MVRNLKYIIPAILVVASITFIGSGFASDKPEKTAFQDYLKAISNESPEKGKSLHQEQAAPVEGLKLSTFSIPISQTPDVEGIKAYEGKDLAGMLTASNEKIWFMMNGSQPEGIVVANEKEPVKMGGKNRSKDLMKMYKAAKKSAKKEKNIHYFELEGQGIFVSDTGEKEEVYLTEGAAQLLDLPAGKKLSSAEVLEKIKEHLK